MTKSSAARIATRAAKFDPPEFHQAQLGMLSERIDLDAYELTLGLIHPEGSPILIAVWDGQGLKRLLPEDASRWADELIAAGQMVALAPVIEAIRKLVRKVGEIVTASIMRETVH